MDIVDTGKNLLPYVKENDLLECVSKGYYSFKVGKVYKVCYYNGRLYLHDAHDYHSLLSISQTKFKFAHNTLTKEDVI